MRIASNPAFSPDAAEAISVLSSNLAHPFRRFWHADLGVAEAVEHFRHRIVGHQQVTDAYLLELASRHTMVSSRPPIGHSRHYCRQILLIAAESRFCLQQQPDVSSPVHEVVGPGPPNAAHVLEITTKCDGRHCKRGVTMAA